LLARQPRIASDLGQQIGAGELAALARPDAPGRAQGGRPKQRQFVRGKRVN
jgi:hypothetical protein